MIRASRLGAGLVGLLACAVGLAWSATSLAEPISRAWVLDSGWNAVVALEPATGRRLATLSVKSRPEGLLLSPDGSRLAVLERGPGEDKGERGYKAKGKSAATIIDTAAMAILGRVELGYGVDTERAYFGLDRVTFFCPGYEAKNPAEQQARELVVLDLKQGREVGRVTLEHGVFPIDLAKDGRTLVLVQGLPHGGKYPHPRSRVWFVDITGPTGPIVESSVDAGGWANLYSDGAWLYLLDRGKADPDTRKSKNGTLQVVSFERRTVAASLDAGREPRGLFGDGESLGVFIPSDGPPDRLDAEMRIVRGDSVPFTLRVAANPKLLDKRRDVVFVVGVGAVTLVDPVSAQVIATLPLTRGTARLVFDDDTPRELQVSPDGRRAFVLYEPGNKLVVLDLEQPKLVAVAKTGRGGKKFLRGVGQVANAIAVVPTPWWEWASVAGLLAAGPAPGRAYSGNQLLALRPDGRFAYALGVSTEDVTVVDSTSAMPVEKIAAGGHRMKALGGGATMAVISGARLHVIDTAVNRKLAELELPGLRDVAVSPDTRYAVAFADGIVLCIDGISGGVIATLKDFVAPTAVVFDALPPGP